jgi:hypothetical protein
MNNDYMKQNYEFKDYFIREYFEDIDNKYIKLPRFQRDIVWSQNKIDELANSLKLGIPFGTFLLAGENPRILLDGLQRTYALRQIYNGPQKFFNKDQIDNLTLTKIKHFLLENNAVIPNNQDDEIQKAIVEWINNSPNTDPTEKFKGLYLAKDLFKRFSVKENADNLTKGDEILSPVIDVVIKEKSNIENIKIPCVIYKGSNDYLPLIFEKLNSSGTSLTKYQIFASNWFNNTLPGMKDKEIKKIIFNIYDKRLKEGDIHINNLPESEAEFIKQDLNLFEYLLGLGNLCEKKFPNLFAKKGNTIGFTLSAACLQGSIRKIDKIDEIIDDSFNFEKFQKALEDSINTVYLELRPYISVPIKRSRGNTKPIIFHSDYQIVSLISKVFREKYDSPTFEEKKEWNKDHKWISNIPYYYLLDQLEDNWRGSGDTRIEEMLNSDRYKQKISRSTWSSLLDKWFQENEITKKQKVRISINNVELLLLNYIYAHTVTVAESQGSNIYNLEHLVPVDLLSKYIQDYKIEGLPISAVSNICYLDETINKKKGKKTIYEFIKENPEEVNIYDIESKYTFTKESDLDFIKLLNDKDIEHWDEFYKEFITSRFKTLKEKFFELNRITE